MAAASLPPHLAAGKESMVKRYAHERSQKQETMADKILAERMAQDQQQRM